MSKSKVEKCPNCKKELHHFESHETRKCFECNSTFRPDEMKPIKTIAVRPDEIKIGDIICNHGCQFKVEVINIYAYEGICEKFNIQPGANVKWRKLPSYEKNSPSVDLPVFVIKGSYVSGNKEMFNYFRSTISSGENCGQLEKLTSKQGNRLAEWRKVI